MGFLVLAGRSFRLRSQLMSLRAAGAQVLVSLCNRSRPRPNVLAIEQPFSAASQRSIVNTQAKTCAVKPDGDEPRGK